jgi:imidazolonepropionase-like amidohydrolase
VEPGELLIEDDRIVGVAPSTVPADAVVIYVGELTRLPGLMGRSTCCWVGRTIAAR